MQFCDSLTRFLLHEMLRGELDAKSKPVGVAAPGNAIGRGRITLSLPSVARNSGNFLGRGFGVQSCVGKRQKLVG